MTTDPDARHPKKLTVTLLNRHWAILEAEARLRGQTWSVVVQRLIDGMVEDDA